MEDDDEYALTEAEVLDTLQFVVAAEQHAAVWATAVEVEQEQDETEDGRTDRDTITESPQTTPSASVLPKRTTSGSQLANPNPYHNRQKHELEYLKTKVRELELELRRVEKENDEKLAKVGDSVWQRMAQQQFVEKQRAMSENARLKEMLEGQIKFAKSLERVIRKRPNLSAFGVESDFVDGHGGEDGNKIGHSNGATRGSRRRKKRVVNASLYDELNEAAEFEFKRTDEQLRLSGLARILRDHRSIDVKILDEDATDANRRNGSDLRVDWTIARRYPFPFDAVAREMWQILAYATIGAHVPEIERTVERTDDTLFATTTLKVPVGQHKCSLSATALIRRFDQEDSVTVIWVSDGECEPSKHAKDTFKLYEVGWIKIAPMPGDPSSCISHTLCHYYPTFSARARATSSSSSSESDVASSSPSDDPQSSTHAQTETIGLLTELVAGLYEKSASEIHAAIENALMAEAISVA